MWPLTAKKLCYFCWSLDHSERKTSSMTLFFRFLLVAAIVVVTTNCTGYLDKPRPITLRCTGNPGRFLREAAEILDRNGFTVLESDTNAGYLMAQDTITNVYYRYQSLVRTWRIRRVQDSVIINVESLSTRLDDSEVRQTWDRRWAGEDVRDWMRPILNSLEAACGLTNPLMPR